MDTKRLILAIALSIVVITVYQYFFMPKPEVQSAPVAREQIQTQDQTADVPVSSLPTDAMPGNQGTDIDDIFSKKKPVAPVQEEREPVHEDIRDTEIKQVVVKTDLFTAVFKNQGAGLSSFVLGDRPTGGKVYLDDQKQPLDLIPGSVERYGLYPFHLYPLRGEEFLSDLRNKTFLYEGDSEIRVEGSERREVVFRFADRENNLFVSKKFVFTSHSYVIGLEFEVIKDGRRIDVPVVFGPDLESNVSKERVLQQHLKIGAWDGQDIKSVEFGKLKTEATADPRLQKREGVLNGAFRWAAFERTYFTAMFKTNPRQPDIHYMVIKEKSPEGKDEELFSYMIVNNPEAAYLGPKDEEILSTVTDTFADANSVVEYGWFGSIAKIMLKGINFIHKNILNYGNYGWAIILFTLFLKVLLFPLTYSSSVSMAKMQTLQPKLKAIKKKYKNQRDPEQRKAMNAEVMALYKQEKVNPAGGCLPMLLQLPILWGFFRLLAVSINVRHEPWILWIKDLSLKDPYYILPILMGVTQIILQKMSPTSGADGAQKKMMYIMPVVIVFFVMNLPSGLTLYWFISNLLQLGQQHIINKRIYSKKKDEERQRRLSKRKKGGKGNQ